MYPVFRAEMQEGVQAALAHTPRPRRGICPLPEGSGRVLWSVRGDVEVEFDAMVSSWGLDICTWSQTTRKKERDREREHLNDLADVLLEVVSIYLSPMTDNKVGMSCPTSMMYWLISHGGEKFGPFCGVSSDRPGSSLTFFNVSPTQMTESSTHPCRDCKIRRSYSSKIWDQVATTKDDIFWRLSWHDFLGR